MTLLEFIECMGAQYKARIIPRACVHSIVRGAPPGYRSAVDTITRTVWWEVKSGVTTLLHELGHLMCGHTSRQTTKEAILKEEIEAWNWARQEASTLNAPFDEEVCIRSLASYMGVEVSNEA